MSGISLDTEAEPWVGTFAGLGRVLVHADGRIVTEPAPDVPTGADDALRFGWGTPLAHLRLGRRLIVGGGLVDPSARCLVLHGPPVETERLFLALIGRGWTVLSGRVQAVEITESSVVAHGDDCPVVVRAERAERAGLTARPARHDTDAVVVEVGRTDGAHPVAGFVRVTERRADAASFRVLAGHDRFDASTGLLVGDAIVIGPDRLRDPRNAEQRMGTALRLSSVPHAEISITRSDDVDLTELLAWWNA